MRTKGKLINGKADAEDIDIALDTCAEVDVISIDFATQRGLKPYMKKYPQLLEVAGAMKQRAHGAFWATWEMTDHRGVVRSRYCGRASDSDGIGGGADFDGLRGNYAQTGGAVGVDQRSG